MSCLLGLLPWEGIEAKSIPSGGKVVAVFDGDTVLLDTGEKVRYLGIDAPEVVHEEGSADCYGEEAKKANADLVSHKGVRLQYEKRKHDSYGRLLAYVFLPDGKCVNAEMIRSGYACLFRSSEEPTRLNEFLALQREAVRRRRGMWGACPAKASPDYVGNRRSFTFHRQECSFARRIGRKGRIHFPTRWEALEEGYRPARCCKP